MAQIHLSAGAGSRPPRTFLGHGGHDPGAAVAALAAGDDLLVDGAFTETVAGVSLALPGTVSAPCRVLSGVPAADPGWPPWCRGPGSPVPVRAVRFRE